MRSHYLMQMPTSTTALLRPKRITAPLDAAARARLAGRHFEATLASSSESSGTEHDADLSGLVHEYFLESELTVSSSAAAASVPATNLTADSDADDEHNSNVRKAASEVAKEIRALLDPTNKSDKLRLRLVADVTDAIQALSTLRENRSAFRRAVMVLLRERGHNAGLCKVRWEKSSRSVAGSCEYIDVVVAMKAEEAEEKRYIVDVSFEVEFKVARPTKEYDVVVAALPEVLVARPEEVRQVVQVMAAAARRSLKSKGLSVPLWRKRRFMMAKWFGLYRRTVNTVPASAGIAVAGSGGVVVCRTIVGFVPQPAMSGVWS